MLHIDRSIDRQFTFMLHKKAFKKGVYTGEEILYSIIFYREIKSPLAHMLSIKSASRGTLSEMLLHSHSPLLLLSLYSTGSFAKGTQQGSKFKIFINGEILH